VVLVHPIVSMVLASENLGGFRMNVWLVHGLLDDEPCAQFFDTHKGAEEFMKETIGRHATKLRVLNIRDGVDYDHLEIGGSLALLWVQTLVEG